MIYRELGKTGLKVSEIGLGAEWLERHGEEEVREVILECEAAGINLLDCWMSEPNVRSNIGKAIRGRRERWMIQGHLGSTWQNGQYVRTRDLAAAKTAFQDLLDRLETDYIDLGMIHFVDEQKEFHRIMEGEFYAWAKELKEKGEAIHQTYLKNLSEKGVHIIENNVKILEDASLCHVEGSIVGEGPVGRAEAIAGE